MTSPTVPLARPDLSGRPHQLTVELDMKGLDTGDARRPAGSRVSECRLPGCVLAHTLRRAAAGASRAARTAGYRPASAPSTSATTIAPATETTGTTTVQPWLYA